ncbi:MAG: FAD-dependent thymidylate synthase, partial [bacterium]|nr:FAD-dependent thymidylate synthase [bacterium]
EEEEEFVSAYGFTEYEIKIDWRETRSRYCRCVYETASSEQRVPEMLLAMQVTANQFEQSYVPSEGKYPLLQDVIDAAAGELAEREAFLSAWRNALGRYENTRAQVLFLEAVELAEEIEGVAREVRRLCMPLGYLYWLDLLKGRQAWPEICEIAQEALENMPGGELRSQAAKVLNSAGAETGNQDLMLQGVREALYSSPDSMSLSKLIEEACRQNVRDEELEQALERLNDSEQAVQLKVRILLMLGRLDEAFCLVDTEKSLGWSSSYGNPGVGLFFGGLLTALTGANAQGTTIQALLSRYAGSASSYAYYSPDSSASESGSVILREIRQGLQTISMEEDETRKWTVVAHKMGGGRIDAIVSNKHRKSYNRAADVLGALMECELLNEREHEARLLLDTYRNQKYKRYSAFRAELKTVMNASALLKPYC